MSSRLDDKTALDTLPLNCSPRSRRFSAGLTRSNPAVAAGTKRTGTRKRSPGPLGLALIYNIQDRLRGANAGLDRIVTKQQRSCLCDIRRYRRLHRAHAPTCFETSAGRAGSGCASQRESSDSKDVRGKQTWRRSFFDHFFDSFDSFDSFDFFDSFDSVSDTSASVAPGAEPSNSPGRRGPFCASD